MDRQVEMAGKGRALGQAKAEANGVTGRGSELVV